MVPVERRAGVALRHRNVSPCAAQAAIQTVVHLGARTGELELRRNRFQTRVVGHIVEVPDGRGKTAVKDWLQDDAGGDVGGEDGARLDERTSEV